MTRALLVGVLAVLPLAGCDGVADLLPAVPADPPSAEFAAMLAAVNGLRAEGRDCGGERFGPAAPLV